MKTTLKVAIPFFLLLGIYTTHHLSMHENTLTELQLCNVEALTSPDEGIIDPNDRYGMKLVNCYKEVELNGQKYKKHTGTKCEQSYHEAICDSKQVWGEC